MYSHVERKRGREKKNGIKLRYFLTRQRSLASIVIFLDFIVAWIKFFRVKLKLGDRETERWPIGCINEGIF